MFTKVRMFCKLQKKTPIKINITLDTPPPPPPSLTNDHALIIHFQGGQMAYKWLREKAEKT